MTTRKQSIDERQIVTRTQDGTVPAAGVPRIQGSSYDGTPTLNIEEEDNEETVSVEVLNAPANLEIESQAIRFAPDGTQYVTLTISFEEVTGAENYEYRIAKV